MWSLLDSHVPLFIAMLAVCAIPPLHLADPDVNGASRLFNRKPVTHHEYMNLDFFFSVYSHENRNKPNAYSRLTSHAMIRFELVMLFNFPSSPKHDSGCLCRFTLHKHKLVMVCQKSLRLIRTDLWFQTVKLYYTSLSLNKGSFSPDLSLYIYDMGTLQQNGSQYFMWFTTGGHGPWGYQGIGDKSLMAGLSFKPVN